MPAYVGKVTNQEYQQIVGEARELVKQNAHCQFRMGDLALRIEPMGPHGGPHPELPDEAMGVAESLAWFADDIGVTPRSVEVWRWVASRWPDEHRQLELASFTVHRTLAHITDDQQRWKTITDIPCNERTGEHRWTADAAKRIVGWGSISAPHTPAEKVNAIIGLARDDEVAAAVTAQLLTRPQVTAAALADEQTRHVVIHDLGRDAEVAAEVTATLLRQPQVAAKAMDDTAARRAVNTAQSDRAREQSEQVRQSSIPLQRVTHSMEYLDLVGLLHQIVATASRVVPAMRGHEYTPEEVDTVRRGIGRARAALDWMETAIDTGRVDLDDSLARLLRGE
ncbi:hypothetical protein MB27_20965 [Actinoplanes utahensis]|uniref:RacO protein n=2 Tax=Actinoplanes utahensis TaxID=1869 RepID=A0A0A6X6Q9_ACTUT|nr:hypothetical protein MB27_20965 [Actinoplanes utahensis]